MKLNPSRFTAMSGKMAAIVGYIIGKRFTEPGIAEMVVSSDGFILARHEGDIGFNDFIGSADDLTNNINRLMDAADLTEKERLNFMSLYHLRIRGS